LTGMMQGLLIGGTSGSGPVWREVRVSYCK